MTTETEEVKTAGTTLDECAEDLSRALIRISRIWKTQMQLGALTTPQMFMLVSIQDLMERNPDGVQPGDLARYCVLSGPGVTATIDDLVEGGYCVRAHGDHKDRRKVFIQPTPYGLRMLAEARRHTGMVLRTVLADWDETRITQLHRLLHDLGEAAEAYFPRDAVRPPGASEHPAADAAKETSA
jgi:DNA-binding MarR family transcriptional regulator